MTRQTGPLAFLNAPPNVAGGKDSRILSLQHWPISVLTTRTPIWPRGKRWVESLTIQAAVGNTDFVTFGLGTVGANNGIRQLNAGDIITIEADENESSREFATIGGQAAEFHRPIYVIDLSTFFALSNTGTQTLLLAIGERQPI